MKTNTWCQAHMGGPWVKEEDEGRTVSYVCCYWLDNIRNISNFNKKWMWPSTLSLWKLASTSTCAVSKPRFPDDGLRAIEWGKPGGPLSETCTDSEEGGKASTSNLTEQIEPNSHKLLWPQGCADSQTELPRLWSTLDVNPQVFLLKKRVGEQKLKKQLSKMFKNLIHGTGQTGLSVHPQADRYSK